MSFVLKKAEKKPNCTCTSSNWYEFDQSATYKSTGSFAQDKSKGKGKRSVSEKESTVHVDGVTLNIRARVVPNDETVKKDQKGSNSNKCNKGSSDGVRKENKVSQMRAECQEDGQMNEQLVETLKRCIESTEKVVQVTGLLLKSTRKYMDFAEQLNELNEQTATFIRELILRHE